MMRKFWKRAALVIALFATGPALAQEAERVGAHTDWSVFVASSPKECYIVSPPTKSVARRGGKTVEVNRGDIRLFVAFRPGEGVSKEVSFTSGYPFKPGSTIKLSVDSKSYSMVPGSGESSEWAWTSPSDDSSAVSTLRAGATAVITGVSSRGTTTVDDFSLMGFTAAVTEAEARCK